MSRDTERTRRDRTRGDGRGADGRHGDRTGREIHYEGRAETAPEIEPTRVEVERRTGTDRRVVEETVPRDRRVGDRRVIVDGPASVVTLERRSYIVARAVQGVDYLFYLLYGLLGIRFVLALLGASEQAGFVQFVNGLTSPFYAPFSNIVARPAVNGGVMDFPLIIALLAYALLHLAVRGLLRLIAGSRPVAP